MHCFCFPTNLLFSSVATGQTHKKVENTFYAPSTFLYFLIPKIAITLLSYLFDSEGSIIAVEM